MDVKINRSLSSADLGSVFGCGHLTNSGIRQKSSVVEEDERNSCEDVIEKKSSAKKNTKWTNF